MRNGQVLMAFFLLFDDRAHPSSQETPAKDTEKNDRSQLGFTAIPSITISLGGRIEGIDLSRHVRGGEAPWT